MEESIVFRDARTCSSWSAGLVMEVRPLLLCERDLGVTTKDEEEVLPSALILEPMAPIAARTFSCRSKECLEAIPLLLFRALNRGVVSIGAGGGLWLSSVFVAVDCSGLVPKLDCIFGFQKL